MEPEHGGRAAIGPKALQGRYRGAYLPLMSLLFMFFLNTAQIFPAEFD